MQALELGETEGFASSSTLRAFATDFDNKFDGTPIPSFAHGRFPHGHRDCCPQRGDMIHNWTISLAAE
jgi:hypothetical protein